MPDAPVSKTSGASGTSAPAASGAAASAGASGNAVAPGAATASSAIATASEQKAAWNREKAVQGWAAKHPKAADAPKFEMPANADSLSPAAFYKLQQEHDAKVQAHKVEAERLNGFYGGLREAALKPFTFDDVTLDISGPDEFEDYTSSLDDTIGRIQKDGLSHNDVILLAQYKRMLATARAGAPAAQQAAQQVAQPGAVRVEGGPEKRAASPEAAAAAVPTYAEMLRRGNLPKV